MDSITSSALEELCSSGPTGLTLLNLWPKLLPSLSTSGLDLSSGVKQAVWSNLLKVDGLQFLPSLNSAASDFFPNTEPSIQSVQAAEHLNLTIVAGDHLRDCFVGLYDLKVRDGFKGISTPQRRTLERLAIARSNGITQSQLAREFGMEGNEIFYVLRSLECQGLIVRQSTVLWRKGTSNEGQLENSSAVTTNMLYLYPYAKHLSCHQRLEITKEEPLESLGNANSPAASGDVVGEQFKEAVLVKDFLPALKAICDKLEEDDRKVLVVKDIKQDLGYRKASGHRAWRNICQKLKDAHVVEEFKAKVNNQVLPCLRLLKKFSPKSFEAKTLGCGNEDVDLEQLVNAGKRGQLNDQVVELPIEHQIYDMIDAEGSRGLTVIEVCKRLGISNKKYYNRLLSIFSRFGMHLRAEGHKRGTVYRVWTPGKFNSDPSNALPSKVDDAKNENVVVNPHVQNPAFHENLALTVPALGPLTSKGDVTTSGKMKNKETEPEPSHGFLVVGECNNRPLSTSNPQDLVHELSGKASDLTLKLVNVATELNVSPFQMPLSASLKPLTPQSYRRYPCLTLSAVSAQREQRILERLQVFGEKFIIRAELQKWLEGFEKEKCTSMDSKTLIRILNKLQRQGQCKCIKVSVPVVTNCGRSRTTEVVLHPSVQNLRPELLGQIHDKLRSFEMQSRGHGLSRLKEDPSIPVLNGIRKTQNIIVSDAQAVKSEAMRTNGFILAKMIRAKLLHSFLWNYLSSSPEWDDALSSGKHGYDMSNPHSTCKLLPLDAAIKAIPLELFLQVVGSTKKFDDLIEKCRNGLRLSDLSVQEYKSLMDTQATGRLSWIVDILRRLKLIRLVTDENSEGEGKVPHATFRHAMELKPYIEEPRTIFAPSAGFSSLDIRPQVRHDFVLLNRKAVDEYWRTLEYCYSAADPAAALHAFPGSAVHEVFFPRSWASVRVMTAEQRAGLLKRIVEEDPNKKLSLKECETIAKDLNLTLQQVLRVYYDKRQQRLDRFKGVYAEGNGAQPLKSKRSSSSRKRKRVSGENSLNKIGSLTGKFSKDKPTYLTNSGKHHIISSSGEPSIDLHADLEDERLENVEEHGPSEEDENYSFISQCAFSGTMRQKKFSWTEKADRQLVIQYVRHRATLGPKFHRTDWASLPDLPAPPDACKRRMAALNRNIKFRKSVMKLCNMLGERYAKHLDTNQNGDSLDGVKHIQESDYKERWDNFDDENVKMAFDEVLQYKWMAKLEASRREGHVAEDSSGINVEVEGQDNELFLPLSEDIQNHGERQRKDSGLKSSSHHLHRKFIKQLSEGRSPGKRAYESLAVSTAVELFKLVFLSTSKAAEVPTFLAETLRRYSEHDLFAAFSYLREKKIMIGGSSGNPFELSQQFLNSIDLNSITSSAFPPNTGKRATKFASWLHEREKDLMEERINLLTDLQCGDIFYLFALVSSGELSTTPCVPDEGVGDAEDLKSLKRKADNAESSIEDEAKRLKSSLSTEGETISRREKGFPGIMISLSRSAFSGANVIELFKDGKIITDTPSVDISDGYNTTLGKRHGRSSSDTDQLMEDPNFVVPTARVSNESIWEAMTSYAEHLILTHSDQDQVSPFYPELFMTVCTAIQKVGDQGLSMEQISKVMGVQGGKVPQLLVEVLEAFGQALKVNAYDSVHVVDALYCSKYFLTSVPSSNQELNPTSLAQSQTINNDGNLILEEDNHETSGTDSQRNIIDIKSDDVHKVTILNLTEEVSQTSNVIKATNELEEYTQDKVVFSGGDHAKKLNEFSFGNSRSFMPILPWINGDGTINNIVYKGLVRRVLGTVMQNPGIVEDDIIRRMDVLNPQSCRKMLKLMILDNHLIVRKMHQTTSGAPPRILGNLLGSSFKTMKSIWREHFFANPLSVSLL